MGGMTLPPQADTCSRVVASRALHSLAVGVAEAAGVRERKNLAGTSAGAIVACLLAVGYHADDLDRILRIEYRKFADYGRGGLSRGVTTTVWRRGLAPGAFFECPKRFELRHPDRQHLDARLRPRATESTATPRGRGAAGARGIRRTGRRGLPNRHRVGPTADRPRRWRRRDRAPSRRDPTHVRS